MRLFREKYFGHLGLTVDLMGAVVNMEDVGYNNKTQSIDVLSGVYDDCFECFFLFVCFFYRSGINHLLNRIFGGFFVFFCRWVAFEKPGFSGEPCILEKGLYASPEDWGALSCQISSIQPILHVRTVPGHMFIATLIKQK